jgi:shikimate kinase
MSTIILTGFMGTGKTTVGRIIAKRLGYTFVDTDSCIVEREGCSINDIFSGKGESYFREIERDMLACVLRLDDQVISTGGGAVISLENRRQMRCSGVVINLTATPDIILRRLERETERPLLQSARNLEMIEKLISERESYYADADIRIDTSGKNVEDVVREILLFLETWP